MIEVAKNLFQTWQVWTVLGPALGGMAYAFWAPEESDG